MVVMSVPDKLLVSGGAQRKNAGKLGEGRRYHTANLVEIDFDTCKFNTLLSIDEPNDHYPKDCPNVTFTSSTLANGILYICTETELFLYRYPSMKLIRQKSFPFLQNTHHIAPIDHHIGVASTGLDLVIILDSETLEVVKFYNALGKDPWHRFSKDIDYRKIHSTKPHESHPNFVFHLNGQLWTTRFNQKDAICLEDMTKRIEIGLERVHDGHVIGGKVYFTCVDGRIVIADGASYKIDRVVDLNEIEGAGRPLGWCRGVLIEGNIAYVAYSRIRQTMLKENVKWLLGYVGKQTALPTRVVKYDIEEGVKIGECRAPVGVIDAIYSVHRASDIS